MIDLKSWNPWHGCRKYSEGCANCYMFVLDKAHKVPAPVVVDADDAKKSNLWI